MLFWSPEELHLLKPFPTNHLMRRRCQVPWQDCASVMPRQALLRPGDVIYFPPKWYVPHHHNSCIVVHTGLM